MARLGWYLALTAMVGALCAMLSFGLGLEADARLVTLSGIGAATAAGLLALGAKFAVGSEGSIAVALAMQGFSFALKFGAVVLGTVAWHKQGQSPMPFLLAFLTVYAVQHIIEVRYSLKPGSELKLRTSEETKS